MNMKSILRGIACKSIAALLIVGSAQQSHGALLAYENFESYTVGTTINGGSGGTGWTGNWGSATPLQATVQNISMSYSGGSVLVNGGSKALNVLENNDNKATRAFASQTGTVYISFLFQTPNGGAGADDFYQFWTRSDTTFNGQQSASAIMRQENVTDARFSARINNTGSQNFGGPIVTNNTTYFAVLKVEKSASSNYNLASVWVNPTSLTEAGQGAANATFGPSATTLTALAGLGIRVALAETGDNAFYDEIRVGTTWESVVVPEPASLVLAGLGGLAVLGIARRRK